MAPLSNLSTIRPNNQVLATLKKSKIREEILQYWMIADCKSSRSLQRRARYCCYTYQDAKREYESRSSAWYWLDRELSSNLAGETGAVYIYKGALSALSLRERWIRFRTKQQQEKQIIAARQFCETHHSAEESHLQFFDSVVPLEKRTRLLPVWRLAGYILGFLPTLVGGSHALYVTVEAVEAFVEKHFQAQIVPLRKEEKCPELVKLLQACCEDEIHHKEDAVQQLLGNDPPFCFETSWWARPWSKCVTIGSAAAAELARRI